jgi:hypothetical protein
MRVVLPMGRCPVPSGERPGRVTKPRFGGYPLRQCLPRRSSDRRHRPFPAYPPLAKKPNYDFEKRKKEQDRKKKKDAKREERLERRRAHAEAGTDPDLEGIEVPPERAPE